ncbi:hypothetical protein A2U01_0021726, partial [Trifolium medium]|nr:hypothetical protein [Trifolium medium]
DVDGGENLSMVGSRDGKRDILKGGNRKRRSNLRPADILNHLHWCNSL